MSNPADPTPGFDVSRPGTLYWTVSLYVPAQKLSEAVGLAVPRGGGSRAIVESSHWRRLIAGHRPSVILGRAIDPLFNDIADRDVLGGAQEFLVAAFDDEAHASWDDVQQQVLDEVGVTFAPPASVEWVTEGHTYVAEPDGLDKVQTMYLKRYWFAHYGGALSYHLSFRYQYRPDDETDHVQRGDGYQPANLYFLSILQKLVSPKEFALPFDKLAVAADGVAQSVFDADVDVALLRQTRVRGLAAQDGADLPFWVGVRERFEDDARRLVGRLRKVLNCRPPVDTSPLHAILLEDQPIIEVPGLGMPRCRSMFFYHEERFFRRLMPVDERGSATDIKNFVRPDHFAPYLEAIQSLTPIQGRYHLDDAYFRELGSEANADQRARVLDYLFLSGFNQNVIDFTNQDVSEILDSTDPLYPDNDDQRDEGFFVRYANHRAFITYVPDSRSLEIGNDYIGTCPYAFLIHVLVMHNEYLDRLHEAASEQRVGEIREALAGVDLGADGTAHGENVRTLELVEKLINTAKLAHYHEYLRYKYVNPFRYDTERDVFEKLADLRGANRKQHALQLALDALEDHATDLALQNQRLQRAAQEAQRARDEKENNIIVVGFSILGVSSIIQMWHGFATQYQQNGGSTLPGFLRGIDLPVMERILVLTGIGLPAVVGVVLGGFALKRAYSAVRRWFRRE